MAETLKMRVKVLWKRESLPSFQKMFGKKGAKNYTSRNVTMRAGVCSVFYQGTIRHVFSAVRREQDGGVRELFQ
eukprot:2636477-Rhodomonas_salina.1